MRKTLFKLGASALGLSLLISGLNTSCIATGNSNTAYDSNTYTGQAEQKISDTVNQIKQKSYQKLSQQEIQDILYLREEEKLARDVYLEMYDLYKRRVFGNIARSEQRHMNAVKYLIDLYGLPDPVAETGDRRGVFKNAELQKLYNDLVAKGRKSLKDALEVGAIIEEVDIADLEEKKTHTNNPIILRVYNNLERGSENHLRAFVKNLEWLGYSYQPQYLSPEKFNEIISSNPFKGRGRGRGHH